MCVCVCVCVVHTYLSYCCGWLLVHAVIHGDLLYLGLSYRVLVGVRPAGAGQPASPLMLLVLRMLVLILLMLLLPLLRLDVGVLIRVHAVVVCIRVVLRILRVVLTLVLFTTHWSLL